jgi:hypothetical protein
MAKNARETWLESILTEDTPDIRLLAFGSSNIQSLDSVIDRERIEGHASDLLNNLSQHREQTNTVNPISNFHGHAQLMEM